MKKIVFAFIACCLLPIANCFSQGIEFVHDKTFDEVLALARKENKLVFMDAYTSWCGPCKRMAANVFPDAEVGAFFNSNFINVKIDMEKGEGPAIAGKYGVRAYPTLFWIDGDGNVVHKNVGGLDAAGLIQQGKKATDPTPGILAGMKKQYAEGNRDVNFLSDYLNTLNTSGEKYEEVFKEYLGKLNAGNMNEEKHIRTIYSLTNDLKSPGLSFIMKNKESYTKVFSEDAFNHKINFIATKAVGEAPRANDRALFDGALELLKANKADDYAGLTVKLSMDYYLRMNDWLNYDKNASIYIKKYAPKNAAVMNDVAWNYYLNITDKANLQKATKWAFEAINTDNKYTYNLTYAYLLYKQNEYKEAERACDYAIIRANEENVKPTSAEALKEFIKKSLAKQ